MRPLTRFSIVVEHPVVAELFRVTALDNVFALHENLGSALAAQKSAAGAPR